MIKDPILVDLRKESNMMLYKKENNEDIFALIYSYYPRNCGFTSKLYKRSTEYLNYKRVLKNFNRRKELDKKCYNILKSIFTINYINKWKNVDYPSLHYSVLLHDNTPILDDDEELLKLLNGRRLDLEIYISLISNYYYTYVIETTVLCNELNFNCFEATEYISQRQEKSLEKKLGTIGYAKLEKDKAILEVPNVETELLYEGEVKVFHCLFSDMEKDF